MWTLTRCVRFNLLPPVQGPETERNPITTARSGFSGVGSVESFPAHVQFDVTCRGQLDPTTSYVRDIKQIDKATVAAFFTRLLNDAGRPAGARTPLHVLLGEGADRLNRLLDGCVASVRWRLTPYHCLEMAPAAKPDTPSTRGAPPARAAILRQKFDFSASHRLHNPSLSDDENRARFGKCNNAAGHGHNYVVEPAVEVSLGGNAAFTHADLEQVCSATIIERFDHKHLNVDTPEFRDGSGVLPTVENIARVFYDLLAPRVAERGGAARLLSVTVWETDRTSSTYPAE
ncbi:MAG: hypothetical protein GIKADHBN_00099 [Phycisphaerales bacterium]|nr:hypothetical protein [Phycisphaerales bacterium]